MTPPRPTRSDFTIIVEAARKLAADLARELKEDPDEIFQDIRKIIEENHHDLDGYRLAKGLDYMGWDIDSNLVEILDAARSHIDSALHHACAEWVKTHQIQPPPIGAQVHCIGREEQNGMGTIIRNTDDGRSTVCFPLLGHNPEGPGTIGHILPWELLTIIHQPS